MLCVGLVYKVVCGGIGIASSPFHRALGD
ncbi:hypothetical protein U2G60_000684 [Vibrio fluvialis]|nr:hypothetical protein [Vibrio fluvialis]